MQKDASELLKVTQDETVMKYYGMSAFRSKAEAVDEISWFQKIFVTVEGIRWVITRKGLGQYIGDIGFHNYAASHSRAEIGFKLARACWHQGIMKEALGSVLDHGFNVMRLNRIEALVDPRNEACLGLLRKTGFTIEGVLREYEHEATGYVDLVMMSLLQREYRGYEVSKI